VGYVVRSLQGGVRNGGERFWQLAAAAGCLALGVLLVRAVRHLLKEWLLWRIGWPVVELSAHPVRPGERFKLFFSQPGPMRLHAVRLTLECEEEIRFTQGSDTHREKVCVHAEDVFTRIDFVVEKGEPCRTTKEFELPAGAMHSFEAGRNQVRWKVVYEAHAPRWPVLRVEYPLLVVPAPEQGDKR
jgi:hypothetical protein